MSNIEGFKAKTPIHGMQLVLFPFLKVARPPGGEEQAFARKDELKSHLSKHSEASFHVRGMYIPSRSSKYNHKVIVHNFQKVD